MIDLTVSVGICHLYTHWAVIETKDFGMLKMSEIVKTI